MLSYTINENTKYQGFVYMYIHIIDYRKYVGITSYDINSTIRNENSRDEEHLSSNETYFDKEYTEETKHNFIRNILIRLYSDNKEELNESLNIIEASLIEQHKTYDKSYGYNTQRYIDKARGLVVLNEKVYYQNSNNMLINFLDNDDIIQENIDVNTVFKIVDNNFITKINEKIFTQMIHLSDNETFCDKLSLKDIFDSFDWEISQNMTYFNQHFKDDKEILLKYINGKELYDFIESNEEYKIGISNSFNSYKKIIKQLFTKNDNKLLITIMKNIVFNMEKLDKNMGFLSYEQNKKLVDVLPLEILNDDRTFCDPYCTNGMNLILLKEKLLLIQTNDNMSEEEINKIETKIINQIYGFFTNFSLFLVFRRFINIKNLSMNDDNIVYCGQVFSPSVHIWKDKKFDVFVSMLPVADKDKSTSLYADAIRSMRQIFNEDSGYMSIYISGKWMNLEDHPFFKDKKFYETRQYLGSYIDICDDYPDCSKHFPSKKGDGKKGGMTHLLINKNHRGNTQFISRYKDKITTEYRDLRNLLDMDIICRYNGIQHILEKVAEKHNHQRNTTWTSQRPFGIRSCDLRQNKIGYATEKTDIFNIPIYTGDKESKKGKPLLYYVNERDVNDKYGWINKYKVAINRDYGTGNLTDNIRVFIFKPGEICSESYIYCPFDTYEECVNYVNFCNTEFGILLLGVLKLSADNSQSKLRLMPMRDWSTPFDYVSEYNLKTEDLETIKLLEKKD